jgi:hypothetical protein
MQCQIPPVVDKKLPLSKKGDILGRGFGAHGHQCSLQFQNFENFKISHFYGFKNYGIKYIDRYVQEECMQKSFVKKYIVF